MYEMSLAHSVEFYSLCVRLHACHMWSCLHSRFAFFVYADELSVPFLFSCLYRCQYSLFNTSGGEFVVAL